MTRIAFCIFVELLPGLHVICNLIQLLFLAFFGAQIIYPLVRDFLLKAFRPVVYSFEARFDLSSVKPFSFFDTCMFYPEKYEIGYLPDCIFDVASFTCNVFADR